eukprot:CAMPEP_0184699126 /NCGR_PEP_ID=MMETSP0313-20130426/5502_1 /TAXON_ID=2792 /ORGANISM="Porphyridium aerugineum, Strain SAG 1380-2" /LENGTH=680 /DNA_ID=CAMNT_0027158163 /DNA_START=197 /DNA_END=2239 /DNA_ORIENTATION=+
MSDTGTNSGAKTNLFDGNHHPHGGPHEGVGLASDVGVSSPLNSRNEQRKGRGTRKTDQTGREGRDVGALMTVGSLEQGLPDSLGMSSGNGTSEQADEGSGHRRRRRRHRHGHAKESGDVPEGPGFEMNSDFDVSGLSSSPLMSPPDHPPRSFMTNGGVRKEQRREHRGQQAVLPISPEQPHSTPLRAASPMPQTVNGNPSRNMEDEGQRSNIMVLKNLSFDMTPEEVMNLIQFGVPEGTSNPLHQIMPPCKSFKMVYDKESRNFKGTVSVTYGTVEEASAASHILHGQEVHGRDIRVENMKRRQPVSMVMVPSNLAGSSPLMGPPVASPSNVLPPVDKRAEFFSDRSRVRAAEELSVSDRKREAARQREASRAAWFTNFEAKLDKYTKELVEFRDSQPANGVYTNKEMPADMSKFDRYIVHHIAELLGIASRSFDMGKSEDGSQRRVLHLSMNPVHIDEWQKARNENKQKEQQSEIATVSATDMSPEAKLEHGMQELRKWAEIQYQREAKKARRDQKSVAGGDSVAGAPGGPPLEITHLGNGVLSVVINGTTYFTTERDLPALKLQVQSKNQSGASGTGGVTAPHSTPVGHSSGPNAKPGADPSNLQGLKWFTPRSQRLAQDVNGGDITLSPLGSASPMNQERYVPNVIPKGPDGTRGFKLPRTKYVPHGTDSATLADSE